MPVEELEAAVVRHYTSRAGDPHRHLHLQINARVFAAGQWRGLHTVGVRDCLEAINGIGHAAVTCDPRVPGRARRARLHPGRRPERSLQLAAVRRRVQRPGRADRPQHRPLRSASGAPSTPARSPGPALRRAWDRRAWAEAPPGQGRPRDRGRPGRAVASELRRPRLPRPRRTPVALTPSRRSGALDRDAAVDLVLTRLGARRSAWNAADIRGEVERLIAADGVVADAAVRRELAEDLTARALARCVPLLDRDDVPEHVRP